MRTLQASSKGLDFFAMQIMTIHTLLKCYSLHYTYIIHIHNGLILQWNLSNAAITLTYVIEPPQGYSGTSDKRPSEKGTASLQRTLFSAPKLFNLQEERSQCVLYSEVPLYSVETDLYNQANSLEQPVQ